MKSCDPLPRLALKESLPAKARFFITVRQTLRARTLSGQQGEAAITAEVLNRMIRAANLCSCRPMAVA